MSFASTSFAQFMAGWSGRILRIVAGLALIAAGAVALPGTGGVLLILVGLVPLAAGTLDVCILSPLLGGPFRGDRIRAARTR